jgi:hypothetical protein
MTPQRNLYRPTLKALWGKLVHINGMLFLIVNQIENYEKQQECLWKEKGIKFPRFMGAALPVTDLTGPTDNGWLYHYPAGGFSVKGHQFGKMKDEVTRRFSCFSVAQGYETFETFLKDTVARYLYLHPSAAKDKDIEKFEQEYKNMDRSNVKHWMELVRSTRVTYGGHANEKLFNFLRKNVPKLENAEHVNNRGMDLIKWYKAASVARHAITHSRLEIPHKAWKYLDKKDKTFFPCKNQGERHFLTIKRKHAEECLSMFAEYGFLIFKCLSEKEGYTSNIPRGMDMERK